MKTIIKTMVLTLAITSSLAHAQEPGQDIQLPGIKAPYYRTISVERELPREQAINENSDIPQSESAVPFQAKAATPAQRKACRSAIAEFVFVGAGATTSCIGALVALGAIPTTLGTSTPAAWIAGGTCAAFVGATFAGGYSVSAACGSDTFNNTAYQSDWTGGSSSDTQMVAACDSADYVDGITYYGKKFGTTEESFRVTKIEIRCAATKAGTEASFFAVGPNEGDSLEARGCSAGNLINSFTVKNHGYLSGSGVVHISNTCARINKAGDGMISTTLTGLGPIIPASASGYHTITVTCPNFRSANGIAARVSNSGTPSDRYLRGIRLSCL